MTGAKPAGASGALGIAILVAVGIAAYLLLWGDDTEADYRSALTRFGQGPIERLVTATLPPAMAMHCIETYGEDQAMIDAVVAYNERTEDSQRTLIADLDALGTMTSSERRAVEAAAVETAAAGLPDRQACEEAAGRIDAGEFDL